MEGRRTYKQSKGRDLPFKSSLRRCASWSVVRPFRVASEPPLLSLNEWIHWWWLYSHFTHAVLEPAGIWSSFCSDYGPKGSFDRRQSKGHSKDLLILGLTSAQSQ